MPDRLSDNHTNMLRLRLLSVNTIAAVVLVTGLATSSLTQAAITLVPRETTDDYTVTKRIVQVSGAELEDMFRTSFYSAVSMGGPLRREMENLGETTKCGTGNCKWTSFDSLAICESQANLTDQLEVRPIDIDEIGQELENVTQSDGSSRDRAQAYNITLGAKGASPFSVYDTSQSGSLFATDPDAQERFEDSGSESGVQEKPILARQDFIYKESRTSIPSDEDQRRNRYQAVQVAWYWCVQSYQVTVEEGYTWETVSLTPFNFTKQGADTWRIERTFRKDEFAIEDPRIIVLEEFSGMFQNNSRPIMRKLRNAVFFDRPAFSEEENGLLEIFDAHKFAGEMARTLTNLYVLDFLLLTDATRDTRVLTGF